MIDFVRERVISIVFCIGYFFIFVYVVSLE